MSRRTDRLSAVLCFGAIAIGIIALTGYVLGNASIASLGTNGKPIAAVAALAFIVLGAGVLALRSPAPAGLLTPRRAAIGVIVLMAADLLSAAFSRHIEEWKVWAARGGVHLHAYPIAALLFIALASALVLVTMRRDLAGHVIASAALSISAVFSIAYFLQVPSFLDQSRLIAPAAGATWGLVLISVAELLARPRGWVIPLLSRTSAGMIARLLLPAAFVVPLLAVGLHDLDARWFAEAHLLVFVAVHAFFGAAIVLATGAVLLKRESDHVRLATFVDSSYDAITGISVSGVIESWNAGAERMYGYTAAEAIGHPIAMLLPPERHEEVSLLLERVRRGERIDPFDTVRSAKDGRRIEVWLSVSPILDYEGNVVGASAIVHDITDRKKAREVIRRQAEQYATMLATTSDGFWLHDLEGRLLDVNDAYCRMSGYSREELLKLHIPDIEASETPEEIARHIRSVAESGFGRFASKHRTKDNRILDVEISASLWRAAGQTLVFVRDITQRKQEQETLQRSEERLQLAQRAGGIGHFSWDIGNNVNEWSDELMALYGLAPGSFGGKHENWRERVFPDDLPAAEAEIQKALTSGAFSCDFRVVWPDASIHWLHSRAKVFFSEDRKPLRMVGVNMDITQRVATERALRESEAGYRELFVANPHPMWLYDLETLAFLEVNDAAVAHYGYRRDEFHAMRITDIRPSEDISRLLANVSAVDNHPIDAAGEWRHRTKDGAIIDVEITSHVLHYGGRRAELVLAHDVTERKRAEEALKESEAALRRHSESLERSNAELERFNRLAVGRELRMIELKRQINVLCGQSGQPAPYVLPEERADAWETS
jgi:PAS domain S-box-containing protein